MSVVGSFSLPSALYVAKHPLLSDNYLWDRERRVGEGYSTSSQPYGREGGEDVVSRLFAMMLFVSPSITARFTGVFVLRGEMHEGGIFFSMAIRSTTLTPV